MQFPAEIQELKKNLVTPAILAEKAPYLLKFAETPEEFSAISRLRYQVFNEEQGKGLSSARATGVDQDEFDPFCSHLFVLDQEKNVIAGTYRIHLGKVAAHSGLGFYSEREFDFVNLAAYAENAIETGRSCVAPAYRNGTVIALLWSGIAAIMARTRLRYLFGCVSLEETDPRKAFQLYEYFCREGKVMEDLKASPREGFRLALPSEGEQKEAEENHIPPAKLIPPLFKGYLRMGARILGEPAFDPDFGTVDFPILLDVAQLPASYIRHFSVQEVAI